MRLAAFAGALGAATFVLLTGGNGKAVAQGSCRICEECEYGHTNEYAWFAIIGNTDDVHNCFGYTCEYMYAHGVHENEFECAGPLAYEAVRATEVLDEANVDRLMKDFPTNVALDPGRGYLQVLDCQGENAIAQFALAGP